MIETIEVETDVPFHCGVKCPLENSERECPQAHWCECCGDCLYCYGESPCYDDCGGHD